MTEKLYDELWRFTLHNSNRAIPQSHESKALAVLRLYQEEATFPLSLNTAMDVEETLQCITNALNCAY